MQNLQTQQGTGGWFIASRYSCNYSHFRAV